MSSTGPARRPEKRGGGFSVESIRTPMLALGVFGIIAGIGAFLVEGQFGPSASESGAA